MNDLISRQMLLEYIHGEPVGRLLCDKYNLDGLIEQLPPVQPEIVRCKDCKYITEHYDTDGNVPYWTCSEWDSGTDYDGFCHYAERRTDE